MYLTIKQLITKKYLNAEGLIKWFNIMLYNEKENCDVHIGHYGYEIYLENVKKKDVEYIKSIIDTKKGKMQQY